MPLTTPRMATSSLAAKRKSGTSLRSYVSKPLNWVCRCESMRRKPLFPPPKHSQTGKNLRNKGRQEYSVLTINGRVSLRRIRWHGTGDGSCTLLDVYLDKTEHTISVGAREIGCRLNGDSKNFDKAAANLARSAQNYTSGETLRVMIEDEGKQVLKAQQAGTLEIPWTATDCQTRTPEDGTTATG